jgi:hypothetical protein
MPAKFPVSFLAGASVAAGLLAGCGTPGSSSAGREDMVYIPPSTGTMVGRWVPKSQASDPTISPTAIVNYSSIAKVQNEGMKSTLSSPSVGLGAPRR